MEAKTAQQTDTLDLSQFELVRVEFGEDYYIHSGFAFQKLLEGYRNQELIAPLDFNGDQTMTVADIMIAMGLFRNDVEVGFEQTAFDAQVVGSNARQLNIGMLVFSYRIYGSIVEHVLNSPGFAFQWATLQDEQNEGVIDWNTVKTHIIHMPVINSDVAPYIKLHYIRKPQA